MWVGRYFKFQIDKDDNDGEKCTMMGREKYSINIMERSVLFMIGDNMHQLRLQLIWSAWWEVYQQKKQKMIDNEKYINKRKWLEMRSASQKKKVS